MLVPREHGAYFQLLVPMVTALSMGRPTAAAVLFGISATAAFLAHESLLVLMDRRGAAARHREGPRAKRWLIALTSLALGAGIAAWVTAPVTLGFLPLVPIALAIVVAGFLLGRVERSTTGEILVGVALSSAALPVALASGVSPLDGWNAWLTWILAASAGTCAVRLVVFAKKSRASIERFASVAFVGIAIAIAREWPWAALAAAPTLTLAVVCTLMPPHARYLRRLGWALAAATIAASAILIVSVRRDAGIDTSAPTVARELDVRFSYSNGESK